MTEVLLRELSGSDIDWLVATGRQQEIPTGGVLIEQGSPADSLHVLLDGKLAVAVSQNAANPLEDIFKTLGAGPAPTKEIARLSIGEIVGETVLLDTRPPSTTIKAIEKSLVLSIPQQPLTAKLQQDMSFAAHFYRVLAIVLSERLRDMVNQLGSNRLAQDESMKRVLFIFGELSDSDIDWMTRAGQREAIAPGTILIQQGRPTDALYIILDGSMSVSVSDDERNPLSRAFAVLDSAESTGREIARLTSGEMVGEMPLVDSRPPSTTVKAIQKSLVLSLPRQQLLIKLQQDVGFASRFYRVLASLLSDRLRDLVSRIGFGRRVYSKGAALDQNIEYDDELDEQVLDRMALAGARFDWMLRRLRAE